VDVWGVHGLNQEVIYLTDSNLQQVQAAFNRWGGSQRVLEEGTLIDDPNPVDPSEDPNLLPPGWVKCLECSAPLKSHKEIEAGFCASCIRANSKTN